MTKPPAGRYVIYNRVLSPTGAKLALTFQGQNSSVTGTPLTYGPNQIWTLKDWDQRTGSLCPGTDTSLEIGWGTDQTPVVLRRGNYTWTIARTADSGYTIQDGGRTVYWSLNDQFGSGKVSIGPYDQGLIGRWVFETSD